MKAKMKLRRLWSILLTLVMVVAQLPTGQVVYAAELTAPNVEGNTIYANGFPILIEEGETSGTTVKYDSDKTAPYDYETVLTENNGNVLTVYAGGNAKGIDTASVLMTGGNVGNIYGGGYCYGSGGSSVGSVEITINGGNVGTIYGGGNGKYVTNDGGSSSSVTTATITVNGGTVSTLYASSPSAGRECSYNVASAKISVAGGTISNIKENAGKSNNAGGNTVTVTGFVITGGSIASSDISLMPTNGEETPQNVSKMELTLKDMDEANNVTNEPLSALTTDAGYPYGMNDVKTDANGKIYVWLPEGTSVSGAESTSGNKYVAGSVAGVLKHKETYTVSFHANGGTGEMSDVTEVLGEYTLPANGFTAPTGKQFKGWATSEDGEVISGTTIDVSENTTLYAIWEDITYTVSFDANGGSGTMSDVTEVLGEYILPANGFTAPEGKHFKCWSVDGVEKAVGDKINVTAGTTVKAVWETTTYTVSFDANGGTGEMADVTNVLGDYELPANTFTAPEGKYFKCWSVDGVEKAVGDKINVTANTTVKAVWKLATADFSVDATEALALLNAAKTGTKDSTWDGDTKTLTLNGVNFTTTATTAMELPHGATIVMADGTTNTIKGGDTNKGSCYGIYGIGSLTISGTGTLNVTGGTSEYNSSYGIDASDVTIKSGTVIATGGTAQAEDSYGIHTTSDVTIEGGTVEATGGPAEKRSYGIKAIVSGSVSISGNATVTAKGGTATSVSQGIYVADSVSISGNATVKAKGGTANYACGILVAGSGNVNINGGSLIAEGTSSALKKAPSTFPDAYKWRTSDSGEYSVFPGFAYIWDAAHTYLEIQELATYTVSFDANGGTGTMSDATGVVGNYTLPANSFTAPDDKQFKGWATSEDGEVISGTTIAVTANITLYAIWEDDSTVWGDVVEEDRVLYANSNEIPDALWIAGVSDQDYSGKAITFPNMRVYYHKKLLKKGTDYTEKYASNIKAGTATIKITGRGNFNGSIMKSFKVNPLSLGDGETNNENLKVLDITLAYTGKVQKGTTTVTYMINGSAVTLQSGRDFTYQYSTDYDYKTAGEHYITIEGRGNYSGAAKFKETIDSSKKLITKMKLSKIANMNADGTALTPDVTLMDGTYKLVKGTDYNLEWQNNVLPGTATVIITGMNNYAGTKITTFKINSIPISKAVVLGIAAQPYTGNKTSQSGYSLTYKAGKNVDAETLVEGTDYTVSYANEINAGNKATIIFTGINRFSGTLKKTYIITPYVLSDGEVAPATIGTVPYQKNGTIPAITVTVDGKILKNGTDYTLKYSNNKSKNDGTNPKSIPTVTIKGKGNYKGTITRTFKIEGSSLAVTRMTATDIAYAQKPGICKPAITLYDTNHTKLTAGTDYDKNNIQYVYAKDVVVSHIDEKKNVTTEEKSQGTLVDLKNDIIPVGAEIKVTVYGKGNYAETEQSTTFRFVKTDISKATVKINAQSYTGYELTPSKDEIVITVGSGKNAVELAKTDYEIISYSANINKGKASMVIHGLDNYGGTKTINFTINSKSMNYTIIFDKNSPSATGTMKNASITEGKALTANAYKWSGHTFKGWSYTPDGEVVFKNKDKFSDPTGRYGRTIILYAIWE